MTDPRRHRPATPLDQREGHARVDTLQKRGDTSPARPPGQDKPERAEQMLGGLLLAVLLVLAVAGAVLLAHYAATRTQVHSRPAQPESPGCLSIPKPGKARHTLT
jgi:hypothetical protein